MSPPWPRPPRLSWLQVSLGPQQRPLASRLLGSQLRPLSLSLPRLLVSCLLRRLVLVLVPLPRPLALPRPPLLLSRLLVYCPLRLVPPRPPAPCPRRPLPPPCLLALSIRQPRRSCPRHLLAPSTRLPAHSPPCLRPLVPQRPRLAFLRPRLLPPRLIPLRLLPSSPLPSPPPPSPPVAASPRACCIAPASPHRLRGNRLPGRPSPTTSRWPFHSTTSLLPRGPRQP